MVHVVCTEVCVNNVWGGMEAGVEGVQTTQLAGALRAQSSVQ